MIEDYEFGRITIDGTTYTSDVIIYPDHVDGGWWRNEGHRLCLDDLRDVIAAKPEVLVIGTGEQGVMQVPDDVRRELTAHGIEVIVAKTGDACARYNELALQKKAVAALHIAC